MATPVTDAPVSADVGTQPGNPVLTPEQAQQYADKIEENKSLPQKIWDGLCAFGRWVRDAVSGGASAAGRGIQWTGRKGWAGLKEVGRGLSWLGSRLGRGAVGLLALIGLVVAGLVVFALVIALTAVGGLAIGLIYLALVLIRIAQGLGLTLSTPYLLLKDRRNNTAETRRHWRLWAQGWRPSNLEVVDYSELEEIGSKAIPMGPAPADPRRKNRPTNRQAKKRPARPPAATTVVAPANA